jgi:molybdopterin-synthase adenylyltransferase
MSAQISGASDRYSRQVRFPGIGEAGLARLRAATVAVIGCGGLGSAAIDFLARSGVGTLVIVDRDVVELSNLHRQLLYEEADATGGTPKAVAAAAAVARINREVLVRPLVADVTPANVERIVAGAAVVIDATDNLETRYLVNDACVRHATPWIYGGAVGSTGMSMTIVPGESPCFRCLYPDPPPVGSTETCDTAGVLVSNVVAVAAHQWTEAIKLIIGAREHLERGLVAFDVWSNDHEVVSGIERRPDCPCCGARHFEFLEARATSRTITLCGRDAYQVSPPRAAAIDLQELRGRLSGVGVVTGTEYVLRLVVDGRELTIFEDGRAIIKGAGDVAEARSLYARYVGS